MAFQSGRGRGGGRGRGNNKFAHIPGASTAPSFHPRPSLLTTSNHSAAGLTYDQSRFAGPCPDLVIDPPPESTPEEDDLHDILNTFLDQMANSPYYMKLTAANNKSAASIPAVPRYSDTQLKSTSQQSSRRHLSSEGLDLDYFPEELHPVLDASKRAKRPKAKSSRQPADFDEVRKLVGTDSALNNSDDDDDEIEDLMQDDDAWDEESDGDDDYNAERYFDNDEQGDVGGADEDGGEPEF